MKRNSILFVDRSASGNRQFVPGFVVGGGEESMLVRFEDGMDFEVNDNIVTYYRSDDKFLERVYQIARVINDENGLRYKFVPQGTPSSSDSRRSKRVPTVYESLMACFAGEPDCPVLDISKNGIALIASQGYDVDETKSFEMWVQDRHYHGTVTIQSAEPALRGRFRYGLKCNPDEGEQNLSKSLWMLWWTLQIKYLESLYR